MISQSNMNYSTCTSFETPVVSVLAQALLSTAFIPVNYFTALIPATVPYILVCIVLSSHIQQWRPHPAVLKREFPKNQQCPS